MTDAAELVARAIARMVPIQGSQWNPGFGERFPQEYSEAEKRLIRAIAKTAVETLAAQQDGARFLCPCCGAEGTTDGKASTVRRPEQCVRSSDGKD